MAEGLFDRDEWMRRMGPLYPGLIALCNLSSFPLPRGLEPTDDDLLRSGPWFPIVGALIGVILAALAAIILGSGMITAAAACLVLIAAIALTRAELEIGLAGTVDAIASGARRLAANSRVTAMPALLAVVGFLALRGVSLIGTATEDWLAALVISQMSARWVVLFLLVIGDRLEDHGTAPPPALAVGQVSWTSFGLVSAGVAVVAMLLAGGLGILVLLGAAAVAFVAGFYLQRRFGGLDDRLLASAACLGEIAVLLLFAAVHPAQSSPWVS